MQLSTQYHREEGIEEGSRSRFIVDGWDGRGLSVGHMVVCVGGL
jgi:hypothetical protein